MKKNLKIALIIIFLLLVGIVYYNFNYLLEFEPSETGKISNTNIFALKNNFNSVYFINTNDGYIMIDAGSNAKEFEESLKESKIDIDDVKWILLTHTDHDHVDALSLFPNAEIYMSDDELDLINGTMEKSSSRNSISAEIDLNKINLLEDGQELLFDNIKVNCIKAPGHTMGSMVFFIDDKYLFTGDAFKIVNGEIGVHPFSMDEELSEKTIDKLEDSVDNSSLVLTSHYGYDAGL